MTTNHGAHGRTRRRATSVLCAAGLAATLPGLPGIAVADMVDPAAAAASVPTTVRLYRGTTLVSGTAFSRIELLAPGDGRIDMTFSDLNFLGPLEAGSLAIVDGGEVLGVLDEPGSLSFEITGPRALFAYVYAVGNVALGTSAILVNIEQLVVEPPPIPLPPAIWALLGGIGLVGWLGRRREHRVVTNL